MVGLEIPKGCLITLSRIVGASDDMPKLAGALIWLGRDQDHRDRTGILASHCKGRAHALTGSGIGLPHGQLT